MEHIGAILMALADSVLFQTVATLLSVATYFGNYVLDDPEIVRSNIGGKERNKHASKRPQGTQPLSGDNPKADALTI